MFQTYLFFDGETLTSSASTGETAVVDTTATGSSAHIKCRNLLHKWILC